jgi:hypothetical protein
MALLDVTEIGLLLVLFAAASIECACARIMHNSENLIKL